MTYLRPHKSGFSGKKRTVAVALGVLALLIALINWTTPQFFPGLFLSIAKPFWRMEFSVESGSMKSSAQLLAENASLQRQLDELNLSMASSTQAALIQENVDLKDLMGRASTTSYILAAVLARPPFMPYDELVIDIGADASLSTTSLVYAPGNVLIGHVREVLSGSSIVSLYSSSGQTFDVMIGTTHIPAVAKGIGGGQYKADVPHGSAISIGDVVDDSALNDGPFGTVISIFTDPSSPFDTVLIAPPVDIYELRYVLVDPTIQAKPIVKVEPRAAAKPKK